MNYPALFRFHHHWLWQRSIFRLLRSQGKGRGMWLIIIDSTPLNSALPPPCHIEWMQPLLSPFDGLSTTSHTICSYINTLNYVQYSKWAATRTYRIPPQTTIIRITINYSPFLLYFSLVPTLLGSLFYACWFYQIWRNTISRW